MLALLRHVACSYGPCARRWLDRDLFKGSELHGKTVGIVGYGRLGRIVARYLKAFDMYILASDPHIETRALEPGVTLVPLAQLLREADLVNPYM